MQIPVVASGGKLGDSKAPNARLSTFVERFPRNRTLSKYMATCCKMKRKTQYYDTIGLDHRSASSTSLAHSLRECWTKRLLSMLPWNCVDHRCVVRTKESTRQKEQFRYSMYKMAQEYLSYVNNYYSFCHIYRFIMLLLFLMQHDLWLYSLHLQDHNFNM